MSLERLFRAFHPQKSFIVRRWPEYLAEVDPRQIVTFGIPLKAKVVSSNWVMTCQLLGNTLHSVFNQSDDRYRVIICCNDVPDIPEISNERVEVHTIRYKRSRRPEADMFLKRNFMGARLRELGGGFYMHLEADDLLHRDLVSFTLNTTRGCIITKGYALDQSSGLIAPVPGVWSVDLDRVCGSTAIVFFEVNDLPKPGLNSDREAGWVFRKMQMHTTVRSNADELGRPLEEVPFPAAVYVVNTGDNTSFGPAHHGKHRYTVLATAIRAKALHGPKVLSGIAKDFGYATLTNR